ncbi:MAG: hypothetical protein ACI37N_02285 [Prevotella sp.]
MITVGLDFGTHQSKICIESKLGVELSYNFFKFADEKGRMNYTLPSIIRVEKDNKLSYGYLTKRRGGTIVRYFKQAAFRTNSESMLSQQDAFLYSIWYIAYILFDLEEKYGTDFVIQMGVPTDTVNLQRTKQIAVQILSSAYKLVEEVFNNDKEKFLNATISELMNVTVMEKYRKELKDEYGMLVFPEAYACLMPLVKSAKIASGMSLMVDIGGGTTDISFFTIENRSPQVYAFYSVNKGLNFLTAAENQDTKREDSNVKNESEIIIERKKIFRNDINQTCNNLLNRLQREFKSQTKLNLFRLTDALKSRPIIYTGGGSTFPSLRENIAGFRDKIYISHKEWRTDAVKDIDEIIKDDLCPILSTAYGLSISVPNDNITCRPLSDIFRSIRGVEEEKKEYKPYRYGRAISDSGFSYGDDYDAWK